MTDNSCRGKGATHYACPCFIDRMAKLEKIRKAADQWRREYENPVPDAIMRKASRERLIQDLAALSGEEEKS